MNRSRLMCGTLFSGSDEPGQSPMAVNGAMESAVSSQFIHTENRSVSGRLSRWLPGLLHCIAPGLLSVVLVSWYTMGTWRRRLGLRQQSDSESKVATLEEPTCLQLWHVQTFSHGNSRVCMKNMSGVSTICHLGLYIYKRAARRKDVNFLKVLR